jgi:hypothetical protein
MPVKGPPTVMPIVGTTKIARTRTVRGAWAVIRPVIEPSRTIVTAVILYCLNDRSWLIFNSGLGRRRGYAQNHTEGQDYCYKMTLNVDTHDSAPSPGVI